MFELNSMKIDGITKLREVEIPKIVEGTYEVSTASVISVPALDEIKYLLRQKLLSYDDYGIHHITDKELCQIMDEIGTEWTTQQGNWPKRFAKVFKSIRKQKFDNDFLSTVGKIARESCVDSSGKTLSITKVFDWEPGAYGDDDSCFWT